MKLTPRHILTLKNEHSLTKEEVWLKNAYTNIVVKLVRLALSDIERFDPVASAFYGIMSIKNNKARFQALLEITSYFWASKGGRGALLEKVLADAAGKYAAHNVPLSSIPAMITARNAKSNSIPLKEWKITNYKRLKFDLVNIDGKTVIILELKNRVDSGGTAAREEALTKKFFTVCKLAEKGEKIFEYKGKKHSLTEMLSSLRINNIEMFVGLFYGIDGKEATIDSDKRGFGSRSKNLLKDYCQEEHAVDIKYDESKLGLSFENEGISVSIETLYGNNVIKRFTKQDLSVGKLMEKVFSKSWDDIWLILNVAISELALLREYQVSHLSEFERLMRSDSEFKEKFLDFCSRPEDEKTINSLIAVGQNKVNRNKIRENKDNFDDQYLLDCLYAYAPYHRNRGLIKESIITTEEEELA